MSEHLQDLGRELVLHYLSAIRTHQTHGAENQAMLTATDRLLTLLAHQLPSIQEPIRLDVIDELLVLNGEQLRVPPNLTEQYRAVAELFAERNLGGMLFLAPPDSLCLRRWIATFAARPEELDRGARFAALSAIAPEVLRPLEPRTLSTDTAQDNLQISTMAFAVQTYARTVLGFRDFVAALREGRDPYHNRINVVRAVQDLIDVASARADFLFHVLALERYRGLDHPYSDIHAANTAAYAVLLGAMLRLDRTALLDLGTSALLSSAPRSLMVDLGQDLPLALADDQRARIHRESLRAAQALLAAHDPDDAVLLRALVAFEEAIGDPPSALHPYTRLTKVASTYDAMLHPRPWRAAMTEAEAIEELRKETADRFEARVVEMLATLIAAYLGVAV